MHAYPIMKRKQGVKTKFKDGNNLNILTAYVPLI